MNEITVSAPGSIGNVGAGYDVLGLAVAGVADRVTVSVAAHGDVRVTSIEGDGGALPTEARQNTAGIAALAIREQAGRPDVGLDLRIDKGIPLESGLGGSAASAAAAAHATNLVLGGPIRRIDLLDACVEAEASVAGRHADNVAPSLLGGLVLVRPRGESFDAQRLPVPDGLMCVVVTPDYRVPTREARSALPTQIPLEARTRAVARAALFVSACYSGDVGLLTDCLNDDVVEPPRLALIPGGDAAINAARDAGALAASISGAGPSLFAFCHSIPAAEAVRTAMIDAFATAGLAARGIVSPADCPGVRAERPA